MTKFPRSRQIGKLTAVALTAGVAVPVWVTTPAAAVGALSVPNVVPYAVDGPTTEIPVAFTVDNDASYVHLQFGGMIAGASCTAGDTGLEVDAVGGTAVIVSPVSTDTAVECSVSLAGLYEIVPDPTPFVVIESDEFNVEIIRAESTVSFAIVEPTLVDGPLSLTDGDYHPLEPRRVGDTLVAEFSVMLSDYELTATTDDSNSIECESSEDTLTCQVIHELTADDLIDGVADLSAIVSADGFAVVDTARLVPVYAENRLEVRATAAPRVIRAGDVTTVTATLTNVGTTSLSDVAVAGAGVASFACTPQLSGLVLQPGAAATCTGTHRATAAEAANPALLTPVIARATAPFGRDSDLTDDDAASPADVDGSSLLPFTVTAAEVAAHVVLANPVVLVPGAPGTRSLGIAVGTLGALADVVITMPRDLAPGVTVACDPRSGSPLPAPAGTCSFPLADLAAGSETTLAVEIDVDPTALGTTRFAALALPVRVRAAGGVDILLGTPTLATAGAVASARFTPQDAGDDAVTATFAIVMEPGVPVRLHLAAAASPTTAAGAQVTACRTANGAPLPLTPDGAVVSTPELAPATQIMCDVTVAVDDAMRGAGSVVVTMHGQASAGGLSAPVHATGPLALSAITVRPLAAEAVPGHGYSTRDDAARPNRVRQAFRVTASGSAAVTSLTAGGSDSTVACTLLPVAAPGAPASLDCTVEHAITTGDLQSGVAVLKLAAVGHAGALALDGSGRLAVSTPHESLTVRVTELSAPVTGTYQVGEQVRVLVHVANDGTLPLQLVSAAVVKNHAAALDATIAGAQGPTVGQQCPAPVALAAGAGTECAVTFMLAADHIGVNGLVLAATASTAEGVGASAPIRLSQVPRVASLTAGSTFEFAAAGRAGVARDARAVAINVTAVEPAAPGYLTVWDCAATMPPTSNVNYQPGGATASLVVAATSETGTVCVYTSADVNLVVDVSGYVPAGSGYVAIAPDRRLDTRLTGRLSPGDLVRVVATGGGVPAGAGAVALSVAAVEPAADGHVTVWPCGEPKPGTSTINFHAGSTRANLSLSKVGDGGAVCIASSAPADLVVDVLGSFPADGSFTAIVPERLIDTRSGAKPAADQILEVAVPADAVAVSLNVAVTQGVAAGFVTVWPCGAPRPATSSVNFLPGATVANAVLVGVGADRTVCVASSQSADLVIDLTGVFTNGAGYRSLVPQRLVDTR